MRLTARHAELVREVARILHAGDGFQAAATEMSLRLAQRPPRDERSALRQLKQLLQLCLDSGRADLAATLLWTPNQFTAEPESVRRIWREVACNSMTLLMGASSMGKSFTPGASFLLEWVRDPSWTSVRCVGPTEDHLRTNLFSHLIALHRDAAIPLPGKVTDLFIGLDPKQPDAGILGVAIPQGSRGAGRLQGGKRRPRPKPHPTFGRLSRLLLLIDEIENVPSALMKDLENAVSNIQEEGDTGFRIVASFNPKDHSKLPYVLAEPPQGWQELDIEKDYEWTSKRGYRVVRLDAMRSENVIEGRIVYPGLQTRAGAEKATQVSGGPTSPGHYTFVRGVYPPSGDSTTLTTSDTVVSRLGVPLWVSTPSRAAGFDLALRGGASIKMAWGQFGMASGVRRDSGQVVLFHAPRPCIHLMGIEKLPKGNSVEVASSVRGEALSKATPPQNIVVDRTGNGSGTHDILVTVWDPRVVGVNYTQSASSRKILEEDRGTARELYERIHTELAFALSKYLEHGFLWIDPAVDREAFVQQTTTRKFDPRRRDRVETKDEYCSRGFESPDDMDGVCLFVHACRLVSGFSFSFSAHTSVGGESLALKGYMEEGPALPDPTNRLEYLEDNLD